MKPTDALDYEDSIDYLRDENRQLRIKNYELMLKLAHYSGCRCIGPYTETVRQRLMGNPCPDGDPSKPIREWDDRYLLSEYRRIIMLEGPTQQLNDVIAEMQRRGYVQSEEMWFHWVKRDD